MKKISLKNLNLNELEQLSREQLKNVLGGSTDGTDATVPPESKCNCNSKVDCPTSPGQKPQDCMGGCDSSGTSSHGYCDWDGTAG